MKNLIAEFEALKLDHELPNDNDGQYNVGFVKAINIAINAVKNCSIPHEEVMTPIQDALYATSQFTTDNCDTLAEGILQYIEDAGMKVVKQ